MLIQTDLVFTIEQNQSEFAGQLQEKVTNALNFVFDTYDATENIPENQLTDVQKEIRKMDMNHVTVNIATDQDKRIYISIE